MQVNYYRGYGPVEVLDVVSIRGPDPSFSTKDPNWYHAQAHTLRTSDGSVHYATSFELYGRGLCAYLSENF